MVSELVSPMDVALSGAFGAASGTLAGFLGIGGGAILPPLFVFALGMEQHRAQGISLAALLPPVGLPAVLAYRRIGVRVDKRLVALMIVGFVVGVLGGAWLAHRVPSRELRWIFAAYLGISALRSLTSKTSVEDEPASMPQERRWVFGLVGALAGVMSGLLGVGGGIVALPMLRRFGRMSRLEAQATTLAMMLPPIGLPAVFVYAREQGGLPWSLLVAVGVGFAVGAGLGARLAGRVNARVASAAYSGLLILIATLLVVRA